MAIYNGMHYIVHFRSGELWHFFHVKNRGIFFRRFGPHGKWEEPIDLFLNTQEDFSVRIDNQDHLHLICRNVKGDLLYMHYNGRVWSQQMLSHFDPVRYIIRYPVILPVHDQIHVIFALGTAFNTGYWSLYHYFWNGTEWLSSEIARMTAGFHLSPFYTDISDKYMHLVYRGLGSNSFQIFYCRYHLAHGIWSTPENVTQSAADCNTPSILIRDDRLHLIWTSVTKNDLTVKYKSKAIRTQNNTEWTPETSLSKPGSTASFPSLAWVKGKLWCVWSQNDTLFGCSSDDGGSAWSQPEELNKSGSYHRICYSTNHPQEMADFQLQWILGNASDTFFLPVAGDCVRLPDFAAGAAPESKEPDNRLESDPGPEQNAIPAVKTSQAKVPVKDTQNRVSLENALLAEIDKQEEMNERILRKLEEQSRLDHAILAEARETVALLKEHTQKLQSLMEDMEQIKEVVNAIRSRGLLNRFFR